MREIMLFCEDYAHEAVLTPLIQRLAAAVSVDAQVIPRGVRGGYGKALAELAALCDEIERGLQHAPDGLVVATDANCAGLYDRERAVAEHVPESRRASLAMAIADPHIERWLLLDSHAFKSVLGTGCQAPDAKCERGRYKRLLRDAVRASGVIPLIGGVEYAEDIVQAMDIERIRYADASFGRAVKGITELLRRTKNAE
jgi:hypothetical protein